MSASRTSPHSARPGSSRCPGFRRKKVTVRVACTTAPSARAGGPVEAARHVDGHDRLARGVDGGDHLGSHAVQRPGKPRTEQRIDDDIGPVERRRRQCLDVAAPARRHLSGIARQRRRGARAVRPAPATPARAAAGPPRSRRRRCCPARTRRPPPRPGGRRGRLAASATARPAASIRAGPGHPAAIASAVGAAHLLGASAVRSPARLPPRITDGSCSRIMRLRRLGANRNVIAFMPDARCAAYFSCKLPDLSANWAVAQRACCPVDTQKSFSCLGICCRVNLGTPHA